MLTIRTKEYTHVDLSQLSATDMETQVNVSHRLRALLPDLLNKWTNTDTCNKPSTYFYRKYVVPQMIFSIHCIVFKMTYDMRDLTYFPTCEVNIMSLFLLGCRRGFGVSLNIHINVTVPFGATLTGRGF